MKKNILLAVCFLMPLATMAQNDTLGHERNITLSEAIVLARTQSVDAAVALNELKTAYWEYRTFRADLLPEVNFTGTLPNYNKSYSTYQNSDGSYSFVRNNTLGLSGQLSVDQNIWFTGGKLSLTSSLDYLKQLGSGGAKVREQRGTGPEPGTDLLVHHHPPDRAAAHPAVHQPHHPHDQDHQPCADDRRGGSQGGPADH